MSGHKQRFYPLKLVLSLLLASLSTLMVTIPANAAEQVILKYSILRESISVEELNTLAETGEVSPSLQTYLKLANKQPEELRNALNQSFSVDPVFLSQILNSFAGEFVLDQVGEVIHTPSQRASREALRGALVTSALSDKNVRVVEVLKNYPTSEVHVEGDRLAGIYKQIEGVISKIPGLSF